MMAKRTSAAMPCSMAVLASVALLALQGCSGSSGPSGSDFGKAVGEGLVNGFVCVLGNCKPSQEAQVQDVRLNYTATQTGSQVTVKAQLGQAGKWAILQLSGGDRLTATIGGRQLELKGSTSADYAYAATFDGQGEQPLVSVSFHRGGQSYTSNVTLPKGFTMLSPSGPVQLHRSSADLDAVLQLPSAIRAAVGGTTSCTLTDGAITSLVAAPPFELQEATATQQRWRLKSQDIGPYLESLLKSVNPTTTAKLRHCQMKLAWTLSQDGSQPTGLASGGSLKGEYAVPLELNYDATR